MQTDTPNLSPRFQRASCTMDYNEMAEINRPQEDAAVDPEDVTRYLTDPEYLDLVLESTPAPLVRSLADFCLTPVDDLDVNGRALVEELTELVTEYIAANGLAY